MISVIAAKTVIIMFISFVYFNTLCPLLECDKHNIILYIIFTLFYILGVGYTIYMEVYV